MAACSGSTGGLFSDGGNGGAGNATTTSGGHAGSPGGAGGTGGGAHGGEAGTGPGGGGQGGEDPWAGPLQSLQQLDLGIVELGPTHALPIPDRSLGFTLQAEVEWDDVIGVRRLKPPEGFSVVFDYAMAGHDLQVFGGRGWSTCANPQSDSTDAYPVQQGRWLYALGSDGSADEATVRLWVRRTLDAQFHGGVVDVNVFLAPGTVDVTYMAAVLREMFPYAGLTRGSVQYLSLPPSRTIIETMAEFRSLLASSAGVGSAPALNVFVVGDFDNDVFGAAGGIAGGIPASPMLHGTSRSGLAVVASGDTSYDATILGHESGHVGGLFHTTELAVEETDPLSDTPSCPYETISSEPSSCPDVNNIMFPIAYGGTELTAAQQMVLHGSALYRGIIEAGGAPSDPLSTPRASGRNAWHHRRLSPPTAARRATVAAPPPWVGRARRREPRSELERVLGGVWCADGGDRLALALRVAGPNGAAQLEALVLDTEFFDVGRSRALYALERAARHDPTLELRVVELSASLLRSAHAGRQPRVAALRVLERRRPTLLRAMSASLAAPDDLVLAQHLRRVRR